jgi:hypothetical protein
MGSLRWSLVGLRHNLPVLVQQLPTLRQQHMDSAKPIGVRHRRLGGIVQAWHLMNGDPRLMRGMPNVQRLEIRPKL